MKRARLLAAVLLALCATGSASAAVVSVEVRSREDLAGGRPYGLAGGYEKVSGTMRFAVRPDDPHDLAIVDLALAPRNARGLVEFSADFYVIEPKDPARGSGDLLLEVPNRGGKGIFGLMNRARGAVDPAADEELGDGFLMRRGISVAWVGWQWDVRDFPGRLRLDAPVATENGRPITGPVRADFVVDDPAATHPLGHFLVGSIGGTSYPVADQKSSANVLTERDSPLATRRVIPRRRWRFAREEAGRIVPDDRTIWLEGGFRPGKIYEVVYTARDPVVAGLGLAAIRDAVSYFKNDPASIAPARRVYGAGISQSGRFLRYFLAQGFNADEEGRRVFDGLLIHVAGAGVGSFNHRFAQPSRDAQPLSPLFYPTDLFPFTDLPETDPETGRTAGLLDRARAENAVPKIFETNTSYEYWGRAASLTHTSPDARADAPLPEETRIYFLAGLQHFSGPFPPSAAPYRGLRATHPQNPNPAVWLWRALFADMQEWVREGVAPPESRYPRIADGTLVAPDAVKRPAIRGLAPPSAAQDAYRIDFGPRWSRGVVDREPPAVGRAYPALVPQVDADGNDRSGVRIPEMEAPVATYTGWNLRDPATGFPGARVSFVGSYVPLPATRAERERAGDPRLSLEERYGTAERYLGLYAEAALRQIRDRFLLPEDLADVLARGRAEWDAVRR
ncbi:MAG TPA: alpha/beta hydrolase domain-containing protein [Thermoanaerobaculia bacterium]